MTRTNDLVSCVVLCSLWIVIVVDWVENDSAVTTSCWSLLGCHLLLLLIKLLAIGAVRAKWRTRSRTVWINTISSLSLFIALLAIILSAILNIQFVTLWMIWILDLLVQTIESFGRVLRKLGLRLRSRLILRDSSTIPICKHTESSILSCLWASYVLTSLGPQHPMLVARRL